MNKNLTQEQLLHAAICNAVALLNVSIGVASCKEGNEAKNILRQALMDYHETPDISSDVIEDAERYRCLRDLYVVDEKALEDLVCRSFTNLDNMIDLVRLLNKDQ